MLKGTKKCFDELNAKSDKILGLLESNELKELRKDSEELKKIKSLLKHIKFKIKNVQAGENQDTGKWFIAVTYELPRVVLTLDENGNPNKDDFFYSTNMLDMISLEDMSMFQNALKNVKSRFSKK